MAHHQVDQHIHCGNPRRRREKGAERIFEEKMAENLPNLMKDMKINIQEAQQTPSKMNSKRPTYNKMFENQR